MQASGIGGIPATPPPVQQPMPPPPAPRKQQQAATAAPTPAAAVASPGGKLVPIVVDVVVVLLLLALGAFLGEFLAGKSTAEVWRDAGSSVKFPPMDLLMWLSMPVVFLLAYGLLISRGQSLGARLRRPR
jgi:hypothetical protein